MDDRVRPPGRLCASQQGLRNVALSIGRHGSAGFWRRSAIVLLGVALLGAASSVREFDISIRDRRVEGGVSTLRVNRGDTVLLRWRSDEAVSLHVHGYDLQANLSAASPETIRFEATVAGSFSDHRTRIRRRGRPGRPPEEAPRSDAALPRSAARVIERTATFRQWVLRRTTVATGVAICSSLQPDRRMRMASARATTCRSRFRSTSPAPGSRWPCRS